jgi:hypothetical protein
MYHPKSGPDYSKGRQDEVHSKKKAFDQSQNEGMSLQKPYSGPSENDFKYSRSRLM